MREYNQQYSEVDKMTMEDCMFFMCLAQARAQYEEQEIERAKNAAKNRKKGRF